MNAAFFDVDGTLTTTNVWRGIMAYYKVQRQRRFTHLAYLLAHYPLYGLRKLGLISEVAFRSPWSAHLAWYVRGETCEVANRAWDWVVEEFLGAHAYWRSDIRAILDKHRAEGDLVVLVSSGPQPLIQRIGQELGTEHAVGTRFEVHQGYFTGRSLKPVCIGAYKASMAQEYLRQAGLPVNLLESAAYADSMADLGLLEMVGKPVAVYPDENLRKLALNRGWPINPQ